MAIDRNEEAERVRRANENVEKWKSKFIGGDNGFSGGVRMTVETQDGVIGSRTMHVGDPKISQKIPITTTEQGIHHPLPGDLPKVIMQPKPWWRRLLNHLLVEKTK